MQTSIERLLLRLNSCKEIGNGRWTAKCPAHDDRNPSLSIQETSDQTVLIKCWAGCTAEDIVQAVNLSLRDLFPGRKQSLHCYPSRSALEYERTIVRLGQAARARGGLTDADLVRYETALQRLSIIGESADE